MTAGRHSMMGGAGTPYKRLVEYIDTNGGGCTMSDIVFAPVYGFRTKMRVAVITPTGENFVGFMRSPSDHDNRGSRFFMSYFDAGYVIWQDIAKLRMRTNSKANSFDLDTFYDIDALSMSSRAESYIKVDGVNKLSSYETRNKAPLEMPLSICKESNAATIYGRFKIASLTLMQGDQTIADFVPVETFNGEGGLFNSVNGRIYTATAGAPFALPSAAGGGV